MSDACQRWRDEFGVSPGVAARQARMDRRTLYGWLAREHRPTVAAILRLARCAGVDYERVIAFFYPDERDRPAGWKWGRFGLTREDVARRSGLSRSCLQKWEAGERKPGRRSLEDVARAVALPPDRVLAVLGIAPSLRRARPGVRRPPVAIARDALGAMHRQVAARLDRASQVVFHRLCGDARFVARRVRDWASIRDVLESVGAGRAVEPARARSLLRTAAFDVTASYAARNGLLWAGLLTPAQVEERSRADMLIVQVLRHLSQGRKVDLV